MNLTIEKLVYGGEGLARLPDGKAVFVPFVLPGEEVSATLGREKSSFARATADEVLRPAATRVAPKCPYFAACGGCHYQHTIYQHQLAVKVAILEENFRRLALSPVLGLIFGLGMLMKISFAPLVMVPVVVLFFLAQKAFVEGVTLTGVKG